MARSISRQSDKMTTSDAIGRTMKQSSWRRGSTNRVVVFLSLTCVLLLYVIAINYCHSIAEAIERTESSAADELNHHKNNDNNNNNHLHQHHHQIHRRLLVKRSHLSGQQHNHNEQPHYSRRHRHNNYHHNHHQQQLTEQANERQKSESTRRNAREDKRINHHGESFPLEVSATSVAAAAAAAAETATSLKHKQDDDLVQVDLFEQPNQVPSVEFSGHLHKHHNNYRNHRRQRLHEERSLPVVVSTSDNSYVSASPIEHQVVDNEHKNYDDDDDDDHDGDAEANEVVGSAASGEPSSLVNLDDDDNDNSDDDDDQNQANVGRGSSSSSTSTSRGELEVESSNNNNDHGSSKQTRSNSIDESLVGRRRGFALRNLHLHRHADHSTATDTSERLNNENQIEFGEQSIQVLNGESLEPSYSIEGYQQQQQQQNQIPTSSEISTTATTTSLNSNGEFGDLLRNEAAGDEDDNEEDEEEVNLTQESSRVSSNATADLIHFEDFSLEARYQTHSATIIKTRESIRMGATFLNYTIVTNLNACLVECVITDSCDTAIYQETPVDFVNNNHLPLELHSIGFRGQSSSSNRPSLRRHHQNHHNEQPSALKPDESVEDIDLEEGPKSVDGETRAQSNQPRGMSWREGPQANGGFYLCYLFQCLKPDGYKCQFSEHQNYISSQRRRRRRNGIDHHPDQQRHLYLLDPMASKLSDKLTEKQQSESTAAPHYSKIITSPSNHHKIDGRPVYHDSHVNSISIGEEPESEFNYHHGGNLNSAIIAILIGIGATGMLIVIVSHKMQSIRQRLAYKSRRRSLVPDADFLINTIPIDSAFIEANLSSYNSFSSLADKASSSSSPCDG